MTGRAGKRGYLGFEYKGVTTPWNFISLVCPFFTHLGIWSSEKVIWSSQRTSINLRKWHGRYFHVWKDDDDELEQGETDQPQVENCLDDPSSHRLAMNADITQVLSSTSSESLASKLQSSIVDAVRAECFRGYHRCLPSSVHQLPA